jgi:hypothetical protein
MTDSFAQRTRSHAGHGRLIGKATVSIQHVSLVLEAADLAVQEKAILIALANHTDPNGKTFAGEERLMRESSLKKTQFRTWRARLVERELILSRRRGRRGGGRTTSDTYLNLDKLRSMRHPFFGAVVTDRPEDENPFSQADSNGPDNRTIDDNDGGNGPVSRTINGPVSRTTQGRGTGPITITNHQGEHTHQAEAVVAAGLDAATAVCGVTSDDETRNPSAARPVVVDAGQIAATTEAVVRGVDSAVRSRVTPARQCAIQAVVAKCLAAGHTHDTIVAEAAPATNDRTQLPAERVVAALSALLTVDPATIATRVTPGPANPTQGYSGGSRQCRACSTMVTDLTGPGICADCDAAGYGNLFAEVAA